MTCRFQYGATQEQLIEARVSLRLQGPTEAGEMSLRVDALPVRRVCEPYRSGLRGSRATIVAHIDP
jgi:hypothetical protein